jgi:hypothetical protein
MRVQVDTGMATVFGSADRVRVLAVLANASRPPTAYRVAQVAGVEPPNVYRELKRLLQVGEVRRAGPKGVGWEVVDPDIRAALRRRCRISWSADILLDSPARKARAAEVIRQNAADPLDLSKFSRGRRPTRAEVRRRAEKDQVLLREGSRVSQRTLRPPA